MTYVKSTNKLSVTFLIHCKRQSNSVDWRILTVENLTNVPLNKFQVSEPSCICVIAATPVLYRSLYERWFINTEDVHPYVWKGLICLCWIQTDQFPFAGVHHGCRLLHRPHRGEDCPQLSGTERVNGGEGAPHARSQKSRTWTRTKSWGGEQWPPHPCWLPGSLVLPFLHALPLPLTALSVWGPCYWPAEHRVKGKKSLSDVQVEML